MRSNYSYEPSFADLPTASATALVAGLAECEGLDYYGECRPAGETCRDFFDFVPLPDGGMLLAIGEISMEGVGAGIIVSGLQAFVRNQRHRAAKDLGALMGTLNRSICDIASDNFYATLFCVSLDPARRQLRYASAGHEPVLLFHQRLERLRRLESTGTVLGLTTRAVYRQHAVSIDPGDVLIACTDGITEAAGLDGQPFGEEGVARVVRENSNAGAEELSILVSQTVQRFRAGIPQVDDQTVVTMRLLETTANGEVFRKEAEELAMAAV
jgi:sigma-B regulation protein RsbU (phosphoserine phosphatase)